MSRLHTPIDDLPDNRTQELIAQLWAGLPGGRGEPKSSGELQRELGLKRPSDVTALVNHARAHGYAVGSLHARGYFRIQDADDLEVTKRHLLKRQRGITVTLDALDRAYDGVVAS